MNKPYVKEFKLVDGEQVLQNPIGPEGYINKDLNRKQRRNLMKSATDNNRAGRHYYSRKFKAIYENPEGETRKEKGKVVASIPTKSFIKYRHNHLRKLSAF